MPHNTSPLGSHLLSSASPKLSQMDSGFQSTPHPPPATGETITLISFPVHASLRLLHCAKYNSLEMTNLVIWLTLFSLCHNFWTPQQNGFGCRPHSPQRLTARFCFFFFFSVAFLTRVIFVLHSKFSHFVSFAGSGLFRSVLDYRLCLISLSGLLATCYRCLGSLPH